MVATGQIADISAIIAFQWMEPVYYELDSSEFSFPESTKGMGHYVCFSDTIGHAMTFQLWLPSTNKIIHRSTVRSAITSENWNIRADESLHKPHESSTDSLTGPYSSTTFDDGEI